MAITYRSTAVYDSSGSATAVVPKPTGTVDGDLMFVVIRRAAVVNPTGVPANWVLVQSVLSTYGWWLYRKVASGEGASWTWTWAASAKTFGRSHSFYGNIDTTTPIQNSTTPYSGTTSGTTITIPTLTTSANNTLSVLFTSGYSTSAKTFTVPTSPTYAEHNDTGNTSPDFWQAIATYNYPTSGTATGAIAYPASASCTYRTGCQVLVNSTAVAPTVTTQAVTDVTDTTATGNGNITDNGGATITEKGVCYMTGTSGDPTTANSKFYDNTNSTGAFTEAMTGFSFSTNYRVRAYAINSAGTSYGLTVQLTTNAPAPPTVALNTPTDTAIITDTTPVLAFTGTSSSSYDLEYNLQVDTVNSFDSVPALGAVVDSYSEINYQSGSDAQAYHLGVSEANGQSFANTSSTKIFRADWYLKKVGSPTGSMYAKLWAHSGTYGTSSIPTGTALAVSDSVEISNLTTSYQLVSFNFTGVQQYTMAASTKYVITVGYDFGDSSNYLHVGFDWHSALHAGNRSYSSNESTWTNVATDMVFYVYTGGGIPSLDKVSTVDTGFTAGHPFTSATPVDYTVQSALVPDVYYWRVRSIDPSGGNVYGAWATTYSFTLSGVPGAGIKVWDGSTWAYKSVKVWNGSAWVVKPVKVWNGSSWITKG